MNVFFVGAKCHARILRRVLKAEPHLGPRYKFPLVYDADETTTPPWGDCKLQHDWHSAIVDIKRMGCTHFVVAIGSNGKARSDHSRSLLALGLEPLSVIHQSVHVGEETKIGKGAQILANTNIGDEVTIGNWCMMHATSSVEHQSVLEDGVTVMAGASLMGEVTVRRYGIIGGHATVMKCNIGEGATVGAGATVVKDVPPGMTVVGPVATQLSRLPDLALVDRHTSA